MNKLLDHHSCKDTVCWYGGKFHVVTQKSTSENFQRLTLEKKRLEEAFADIGFQGVENVAICFGQYGVNYEARILILCDDVFPGPEKIWVPCHPVSSLAREKAPLWIRRFCKKICEFFESKSQVGRYVTGKGMLYECVIDKECNALRDFLKQHQYELKT